jgi:DNA helicase HerA-like ATPase
MLPTPGSTALTEALRTTVRLQRHYGARLIISTQEPTLLTDLIALCSITVLHRFSSPEWFAAIKKHIPMAPGQYQANMLAIEGLETGTALVYSPSAVLGQHKRSWKVVRGEDEEEDHQGWWPKFTGCVKDSLR